MANTFKNAQVAVLTSDTTLYTCPASTDAIVFNLVVSNIDNTESIDVTVKLYDDSGAVTRSLSGVDTPIPIGSALELGKVTLEASDEIRIIASKVSAIEAFAAVLEIS